MGVGGIVGIAAGAAGLVIVIVICGYIYLKKPAAPPPPMKELQVRMPKPTPGSRFGVTFGQNGKGASVYLASCTDPSGVEADISRSDVEKVA